METDETRIRLSAAEAETLFAAAANPPEPTREAIERFTRAAEMRESETILDAAASKRFVEILARPPSQRLIDNLAEARRNIVDDEDEELSGPEPTQAFIDLLAGK